MFSAKATQSLKRLINQCFLPSMSMYVCVSCVLLVCKLLLVVYMKQKSESMLKWLIGKYSVQAHLMHRATYSFCMNNYRFKPWIQFLCVASLRHWRQCTADFKPSNTLVESLNSIMLFCLCVFSLACIVFYPQDLFPSFYTSALATARSLASKGH